MSKKQGKKYKLNKNLKKIQGYESISLHLEWIGDFL